jgi:hypothetical protein
MSGWDTLRGVGFQHAASILAALDVVEDPGGVSLQIEGAADIVDLQIRGGRALRTAQVRSREEPYTWQPAELAQVLNAWLASNPGPDETFEFISDSQLSPDSAKRLRPALERLATGDSTADHRGYLVNLGLPDADDRLRRVTFKTRVGPSTALLATATTRVSSLRNASGASIADASDAVARLFQLIAIRGGEKASERRLFSRSELAEALGVDLAMIDAGSAWDESARRAYLDSFAINKHVTDPLTPPEPKITQSGTMIALSYTDADSVPTISFAAPPTVVDLLSHPEVGIAGPAGSGKSTTLRLLAEELANAGRVPALISAASYTQGDLLPRVQRAIQRRVGRPLRPDAAAAALHEPNATLLIDGLTGVSEQERQAMVGDLRLLRERLPELRVIATDRDSRLLRRVGLTVYELSGLDHRQRRELATAVVGSGDADTAVEDVAHAFPDASSNPLLLTMALRLWDAQKPFEGAMALYDAALQALRGRSDAGLPEFALEAVTRVSFHMVETGQYSVDLYWLLTNLRTALDEIATEGVFDTDAATAESTLASAKAIGLLQSDADEAAVAFVHDSFRDFLVARALAHGPQTLPAALAEPWEPATVMFAQAAGVSRGLAAAAQGNLVLLAKLAPLDKDIDGERFEDAPATVRFVIDTHLGTEPLRTPRAQLALALCETASHRYVLLTPDEPSGPIVGVEELGQLAPGADLIMAFPATAGPVSMAFGLWRELITLSTSRESLDAMDALPEDDNELVAFIARDYKERQEVLRKIVEAHTPTIADRLIAEIGWYGLTARLGRLRKTHLGPGFVESSRTLYFDTRTNAIDVGLVDDTSSEELATLRLASHSELDSYLAYQPSASALEAFRKQLDKLTPREDLRA